MAQMIGCVLLAAVNLLQNPSFEDWPDGEPLPKHWQSLVPGGARVSRLYAHGTDGQYALRYTHAGVSHSVYQEIPVTPGKFYNITCDARCDVRMYAFEISTSFFDRKGRCLGLANRSSDKDEICFTEPWTRLAQYNMPAPTNAVRMRVQLTANDCCSGRGVGGTLDVDNVSVTESASVFDDRPVTIVPTDALEVLASELRPGNAEAGVLVRAGAKPVTFTFSAESPVSGNRVVLGGRTEVSLKAHEERSVFLPLETADPETRLTVFVRGRAVWRRRVGKDDIRWHLDLNDLYDVRKDTICVANDTWWFNNFLIERNSTKSGARIFFEVPEGVEIRGVKFTEYGHTDLPLTKPLSVKESAWNGVKTRIYELGIFYDVNRDALVVMRSSLPEGAVVRTRGWVAWPGGQQVPQEYVTKIVTFGRVKPFERMNSRMCDMQFGWMEAVSDDPVRDLPALGINALALFWEPAKEKLRYDGGKTTYAQKIRAFVDEARTSGVKWYFYTPNELSLNCWYTNSFNNHAQMLPDPAAAYRNIDGGLYRYCGYVPPCPTYRGTNFHAEVKWVLGCEAMCDFGVTWIALDWEHWSQPCYCDRCRRIFRENWCPGHKLPDFGDPRDFMRDARANKEASAAYWAFFLHSRAQVYRDLKAELDKGLDPNRTEWSSPFPGRFALSDWCWPSKPFVGAIDQFECASAFRHPKHVMDRLDGVLTNVVAGTSARMVASMCPMQGCEFCFKDAPIAIYYNVFECATAGMIGFEHYYARIYEAMSWKYLMDGLRAIRPFEDVIMDGRVMARGEGENCLWRRIALKDEGLYCVRNYALEKPQTVSFAVNVRRPCAAYDCATHKKLADLKSGVNHVQVGLDPDHQAKLIYVGTRFAERQKAVK